MKELKAHDKELGYVSMSMGSYWRLLNSKSLWNCVQGTLIVNEEIRQGDENERRTSLNF